jgi:hypothetical protein
MCVVVSARLTRVSSAHGFFGNAVYIRALNITGSAMLKREVGTRSCRLAGAAGLLP